MTRFPGGIELFPVGYFSFPWCMHAKLMKSILLIFVFFTVNSFGQDLDSLKAKILKMDVAVNNIHFNMQKSHNEFRAGTLIMAVGAIVTGIWISGQNTSGLDEPRLMYAGISISAIGAVLMIDSHKWIGRGARRKK